MLPGILNAQIMDAAYVDGAIVAVGRFGDIYRAQVACPQSAATPLITMQGDSLCTNLSGTAQWYLGGGPLPGDGGPCIEALEEGSYTVVVTDALGCASPVSAPYAVVHTGVAATESRSFQLVPNPASSTVRVERTEASPARLTVLDAQGRTVIARGMDAASGELDVSGLERGVYLVRMASGQAAGTVRLVVQ